MKSKEVFTIILVRTSLNIEFYFAIRFDIFVT